MLANARSIGGNEKRRGNSPLFSKHSFWKKIALEMLTDKEIQEKLVLAKIKGLDLIYVPGLAGQDFFYDKKELLYELNKRKQEKVLWL